MCVCVFVSMCVGGGAVLSPDKGEGMVAGCGVVWVEPMTTSKVIAVPCCPYHVKVRSVLKASRPDVC